MSVDAGHVGDATVIARIDLLIARDDASNCELVAKGVVGSQARGWVYAGGNIFRSDRAVEPLIDKTALRQLAAAAGQELVYTCVPPGSRHSASASTATRTAFFDRDELDVGSDPAIR